MSVFPRRIASTVARSALSLRSAATVWTERPGRASQTLREAGEAGLVAGDQDQVVATLGQTIGIDGANTSGCAGD